MKPRLFLSFYVVLLMALACWCPRGGHAMVPEAHRQDAGLSLSTSNKQSTGMLEEALLSSQQQQQQPPQCPAGCQCMSEMTDIECTNSNLTKVPQDLPTSATRLCIKNNNVSNLDNFGFDGLDSLEVLEISHNNIQQIGFHSFQSLPKLGLLDLSSNRVTNIVARSVFRNLTQLSALNMSENDMEYVDEFCFVGLKRLTVLDLSYNKLREIHKNSFSMLINLELLNLSNNKLNGLVVEWFRTLTNLRTLFLRYNQVTVLENEVFNLIGNLEILDLSYNALRTLQPQSFSGLQNLKFLDLKRNYLYQFPKDVFSPLTELSSIDLSGNRFHAFHSIFYFNTKLDTMYLNNLPNFSIIHEDTFVGLDNLRQLWITNNQRLHFIHPLSFSPLKTLQLLHLSQNNLSSLNQDVLFDLQDVKELALDGNKWNCDCMLQWLSAWVNETQVQIINNDYTKCYSPQEYEKDTIYEFPWHDLNCSEVVITSDNAEVYSRVGATALLECQAHGNPPPSLTWVLPRNYVFHWYPPDVQGHWYIPYLYDHPVVHDKNRSHPGAHLVERVKVLKNGNLYISQVHSVDAGIYTCLASNSLGNETLKITLSLNYQILVQVKVISILVGLATSVALLLLLLIFQLINMALNRWGCCCCEGVMSPKAKQIRKMLESVEQYKSQQLDRLRDNYTMQVHKIKDNCTQQMERIRESYATQVERLRDIREFGNLQIDRLRDQYFEQVKRVREYSFQQMNKVRENYIFQRNRIRKFSAHQLLRLRENYKLQQQHLNKILETLNIESCRTGCSRTDSLVFNPDALMDNVFITTLPTLPVSLVDQNMVDSDMESHKLSYFTPEDGVSLASSCDLHSVTGYPTSPSANLVKIVAENAATSSAAVEPTFDDESPSHFTLCLEEQMENELPQEPETEMSTEMKEIKTEEASEPVHNRDDDDDLPEDVSVSCVYSDSSKETSV